MIREAIERMKKEIEDSQCNVSKPMYYLTRKQADYAIRDGLATEEQIIIVGESKI